MAVIKRRWQSCFTVKFCALLAELCILSHLAHLGRSGSAQAKGGEAQEPIRFNWGVVEPISKVLTCSYIVRDIRVSIDDDIGPGRWVGAIGYGGGSDVGKDGNAAPH